MMGKPEIISMYFCIISREAKEVIKIQKKLTQDSDSCGCFHFG